MHETVRVRKAGRPTTEETEQLRETIVRAALKIFKASGFPAATFEQIASEAGTTRRSVSARFPDKNDLLLAAIELFAAEHRQSLITAAVVLAQTPLDAVRSACKATFDGVCDEEFVSFFRLAIAETARNPAAGAVLIRHNELYAQELEVLIVRAQREGFFVGQDPESTATALIGVFLSNPLNRRAFGDLQFKDETRRLRYFDSLWALVAHASN
jgi:TetR/AcrR family transcriptional repressor of mexJK operon